MKDRSVIMQTGNRDPAAVGEYAFYAKGTNSTFKPPCKSLRCETKLFGGFEYLGSYHVLCNSSADGDDRLRTVDDERWIRQGGAIFFWRNGVLDRDFCLAHVFCMMIYSRFLITEFYYIKGGFIINVSFSASKSPPSYGDGAVCEWNRRFMTIRNALHGP